MAIFWEFYLAFSLHTVYYFSNLALSAGFFFREPTHDSKQYGIYSQSHGSITSSCLALEDPLSKQAKRKLETLMWSSAKQSPPCLC